MTPPMTTAIETTMIQKPVQLSAYCTPSTEPCIAYMWFRLRSAPVANTSTT